MVNVKRIRRATELILAAALALGAQGGIVAAQSCDPNYSGACVPIASDVDCAYLNKRYQKGNGPKYVLGPVRVVGKDIYGLDSNNDKLGCEWSRKK